MFYSVAVRQLFLKQTGKKKDPGPAGEWQLRPFPSSPHSISLCRASQPRIYGAGSLSNFQMLNSLWAVWDSFKRVIKVLRLNKLKSLRGRG